MSTHNQPPEDDASADREVTFFTIVKSVFSSFIGIQSNANRRRDFESGRFWHFFAAGLVFVVLFVLAILMGVKYLIAAA